MQTVNPIDKIRKRLDAAEKDRDALNNEVIRLSGEIERLIAERDGFRNGQAQLQAICDGLQDAIKKYADERKELIAENDRLKTELTAAAFNELPF